MLLRRATDFGVRPLDHAMPNEPHFESASGKELREKYGLSAENRPTIHLDASRVPVQFRQWIPLAERWGISDDLIRDDCVYKATSDELRELLAFGDAYDAVLTEWLAGPDADSPPFSEEYVAFTCLGMAWDLARVLASKDEDER
jgi:hypothetical protein